MTEREILKKLVETWDKYQADEFASLDCIGRIVSDARCKLAATDPPPEHPAVVGLRAWFRLPHNHFGKMGRTGELSCAFLAGWKQALEWSSREAGGMMRSMKWFNDASNATPEHLP